MIKKLTYYLKTYVKLNTEMYMLYTKQKVVVSWKEIIIKEAHVLNVFKPYLWKQIL